MQCWSRYPAAIFIAAILLSQASVASPPVELTPRPGPAEIPGAGPQRPDRKHKFHELPTIPFSELHFASDELRRRAEHFHHQADALVAKQGRADRYKDATDSNHPQYPRFLGSWRVIEGEQGVHLELLGNTIDGRDVFKSIRAGGQAGVGSWSVRVWLQLTADTRLDWDTISVSFLPIEKPNQLPSQSLRAFNLLSRDVFVRLEEGTLRYEFRTFLLRSTDGERIARLLYGTPEDFLKLASEDLESLRKQTKRMLPSRLTVYDNRHVSSAEPPQPMPVDQLSPETRAKVEAAIDARLDADLAVLKADYRDLHQAIQLALPREMFEGKKKSPK